MAAVHHPWQVLVAMFAGWISLLLVFAALVGGRFEAGEAPEDRARLHDAVSEIASRDAMCGSRFQRDPQRAVCSEDSWQRLCEELKNAQLPDAPAAKSPAAAERVSFVLVERNVAGFVGRVTGDLLCSEDESEPDPERKWNYLETLGRHGGLLEVAADAFAQELRSAESHLAGRFSDLDHGARLFAEAQELGYGPVGGEAEKEFRMMDSDGNDFTEAVVRELAEKAVQPTADVYEFRETFSGRQLARFDVVRLEARLYNALSALSWAASNLIETGPAVDIPFWLTGGEIATPGSKRTLPDHPAVFLLESDRTPLRRPSVIPEGRKALTGFLDRIDDEPNVPPTATACAELAAALNDLATDGYDAIVQQNREDNPADFRSAGSELVVFQVLETLSRGNRILKETCGQDRNALRWHRKLIQHTVDLTRDLDPPFGEFLRDILENTFGERIDSPAGTAAVRQ